MEQIYTGREKKLHYTLAKRLIARYNWNTDDIARISFTQSMPTDDFPLWRMTVTLRDAEGYSVSDNYFIKDGIEHGFSVTWANLKKGKF